MSENLEYKTGDHSFRSKDEYANAKYDITANWLQLGSLSGSANKRIANVGCGSGEFSQRDPSWGYQVVACEPEGIAFEIAKKSCSKYPNIQIKNVGLEELSDSTLPVDFLVMHDVLEHIENENDAIYCIAKLVKKGGQVVISVPAFNWLFGNHDVQLGHFRRYTRSRLIQLFEKDFEILNSRYYGSFFIPVTLLFSRIFKKNYPTAAVTSSSWKQMAFKTLCQVQRTLPEPIGTSVLIHGVRK
jgi:2-polyprenyl-3-methyl-5-hydroxy-6-metoxy-1,4-benzoquinol methylase